MILYFAATSQENSEEIRSQSGLSCLDEALIMDIKGEGLYFGSRHSFSYFATMKLCFSQKKIVSFFQAEDLSISDLLLLPNFFLGKIQLEIARYKTVGVNPLAGFSIFSS